MPQALRPTYFAFLGRISPEKAVDRAIWIAKRCGVPLKIAAKVDAVDRNYFESEIRKLLTPPDVEYIGEISEVEKSSFLSGAIALLAPIAWPEPFGLVLIEAMACGTPVIAFNRGAVPEAIGLPRLDRSSAPGVIPYTGQTLRVMEGFTATPFVTGLEHPRRLLVLPSHCCRTADRIPDIAAGPRRRRQGGLHPTLC
jgi:Glycosyl transferases group 1